MVLKSLQRGMPGKRTVLAAMIIHGTKSFSSAIFSWFEPFFRGLPKGSHHGKMGSVHEKISVFLRFFFHG